MMICLILDEFGVEMWCALSICNRGIYLYILAQDLRQKAA